MDDSYSMNMNSLRSFQRYPENIPTSEKLQHSINLLEETVVLQKERKSNRYRQSAMFKPQNFYPDMSPVTKVRNSPFEKTCLSNVSFSDSFLEKTLAPKIEPPEFTSNISVLLEDHPGVSASMNVYREFMDALLCNTHDNQIFSLLTNYHTICSQQASILNSVIKSAGIAPNRGKFDRTLTTLNLLEQEAHTWTLLLSLFRNKFTSELGDEAIHIDSLGEYKSDRDIVDELYKKDSALNHSQLVIDWLENIAQQNMELEGAATFLDKAVAWENTLAKLGRKNANTLYHGRQLITEMDPDAPFRQTGQLDDLDKEHDDRLLKFVFACIRAGKLDTADQVCIQCGQAWRAASLEGWRLHHDPNYNNLRRDCVVEPVEGNPLRGLWKSTCWGMAADPKVSLYEKAVYGALSGNLKAMLVACNSWKDYVWAYHRVLTDRAIESELALHPNENTKLNELPSQYWERGLTPETIFKEIESSDNEKIRDESQQWYCVIQKQIILMDFNGLLEICHSWVQLGPDPENSTNLPAHVLRFIVHLVLYLQRIGHSGMEEMCAVLLENYVKFLVAENLHDLVATYVKCLPQRSQVSVYSSFLQKIESEEQRKTCLQLAEDAGLNVPAITKLVVENIRNERTDDFIHVHDPTMEQTVSMEDQRKINAIDWLMFDVNQRTEAMKQGNAIMRSFMAIWKTAACREVQKKISLDSIAIIRKNTKLRTRSEELTDEENSIVREFMAISAYLDAIEAFNHWFNFQHRDHPAAPIRPEGVNFTDQVAFEHRLKQHEIQLSRWQITTSQYAKAAKESMYNVLLFPQGWMTEVHQPVEILNQGRSLQLSRLRQICLPRICLLLHKVLHESELYVESLRLADIIASEDHKIYKAFQSDELQHFLDRLRESSMKILKNSADPLGYS